MFSVKIPVTYQQKEVRLYVSYGLYILAILLIPLGRLNTSLELEQRGLDVIHSVLSLCDVLW